MKAVILVPFRPEEGTRWREKELAAVKKHVAPLGLPIHLLDSGTQPFSVARSYNLASDLEWDVAILQGADVFAPIENMRRALETDGMTYAFDSACRLDVEATEYYLQYGKVLDDRDHVRRWTSLRWAGGPRAITRPLWETVKGFDRRFVGWGGEDKSFAHACRLLGHVTRLPGELVTLWAPTDPTYKSRWPQNRRVWKEYLRCQTADEMRALLMSRR